MQYALQQPKTAVAHVFGPFLATLQKEGIFQVTLIFQGKLTLKNNKLTTNKNQGA